MPMHKPFKPISDQITLLESRGVRCDADTMRILMREGYYSIVNGYKDPFLDGEASRAAKDDRYLPGTSFNDIYRLFLFDRELRFLLFKISTSAEALLRTACAYCFSQSHPDERNAYLNPANLNQEDSVDMRKLVKRSISQMESIIERGEQDPADGGKEYLHHCKVAHDGEVPLWVLTNDMMLGQTCLLFRSMTQEDRGAVARQFESLYASSHNGSMSIRAPKLTKVYVRIKDFRNICAHDERLYCARPYGENNTLFQVMKDLHFTTTKAQHLEFLQQAESLMMRVKKEIPSQACAIISAMGVDGLGEFRDYMDQVRKS